MVTVERIYQANAAAWDLWTEVARHPASWVGPYLAGRRLTVQAGHAPAGWTNTIDELRRRGFTDVELQDAGLGVRTRRSTLIDRFRDRLVLPVRTATGQIAGFTARKAATDTDPAAPKYLNTPETAAYRKSDLLYGLGPQARARLAAGARLVLVEGALDAAAIDTLGDEDLVPVAPCGTALTSSQLDVLRQASPDGLAGVLLCYDADTAGTTATLRAWRTLTATEAATVQTVALPAGSDPADLVQAGRSAELRTAVDLAAPLSHAVIDAHLANANLVWLEGRIAAARAAAADLAALPHQALAQAAMHLIARLGDQIAPYLLLSIVLDALDPDPAND